MNASLTLPVQSFRELVVAPLVRLPADSSRSSDQVIDALSGEGSRRLLFFHGWNRGPPVSFVGSVNGDDR